MLVTTGQSAQVGRPRLVQLTLLHGSTCTEQSKHDVRLVGCLVCLKGPDMPADNVHLVELIMSSADHFNVDRHGNSACLTKAR
jgi:hypothetical protein